MNRPEANLIVHEGQPGVFIPLNGKVMVSLKLHRLIDPDKPVQSCECDGYITTQAILTSIGHVDIQESVLVHGFSVVKSVAVPRIGLESYGKWEYECH